MHSHYCWYRHHLLTAGPKPYLLPHSTTEELCCLLASVAADKETTIEFGAHQAILVRSQEAKELLPAEFEGTTVLIYGQAPSSGLLVCRCFHSVDSTSLSSDY